MEPQPKRIPQLDGIRGIAILLVLLWHYSAAIPSDLGTPLAYILRLFVMAWSGVDLFFVLSGFLIGGILIDSRQSPNYFKTFYIRRAFRILPLYFVVLVAAHLLGGPLSDQSPPLPYFVSFTQNIWQSITGQWNFWLAHTWSLAVEEQFYLALPLVIYAVPRRHLTVTLLLMAAAAPIWRIATIVFFPGWPTANYVLLPARMDALLIGALCAIAMRDPATLAWLRQNQRTLYGATALLSVFPITATVFRWPYYTSATTSSIGFTIIAGLFACILLLAVTERHGPVRRVASLAPLRRLGILAYCVYLIHPLVIHLTTEAFGPRWYAFLFSAAAILLLAEISWRFFESPLLKIGHRWRATPRLAPKEPTQESQTTFDALRNSPVERVD